jgi:5-methylcytosine-specific restriction endonuclease McrA
MGATETPEEKCRLAESEVFQATRQSTARVYRRGSEQRRTTKQVHLYQAAKTPIVRHRKIKGAANPYDQEWEVYFGERLKRRMVDNLKGYRRLLQSRLEQDGKCLVCGQKLTEDGDWNAHHLCKRVEGGEDTLDNLVLLHSNCHRQVHCQGWRVSKPHPVKRALREA